LYYFLENDTFVRRINGYGYIYSQLTKRNQLYSNAGLVFLQALSKAPQTFEEILLKISKYFPDTAKDNIANDLNVFLKLLKENYFIGEAKSIPVSENTKLSFTYKNIYPTTNQSNVGDNLKKILNQYPNIINAQLEITSICNERCIHCYIPHDQKTNILSYEAILNILKQLYECGTVSITLTGGEIFMHPDIFKIIEQVKKLDFSIVLLSNLTLLEKEHIKFIKEMNVGCIYASLYSIIESEHDYITQLNGSFKKTFNAINLCIENDIPVQISCPIMKTNYKNLDKLFFWGKKHNLKVQTDYLLMARYNCTTDNLDERINIDETKTVINYIIRHDSSYKKLISKEHKKRVDDEDLSEKYICHIGKDKICIGANGNIFPCPGWQAMVLGNIFTDKILDVWNTSEKLKWLRGIKRKDFSNCLNCKNIDYCSMCIGRNFNENNGDLYKMSEQYCKVAELNRILVEQLSKQDGIYS
jgi:radical SAM protein with 4Fe4S-binding SPASM domain